MFFAQKPNLDYTDTEISAYLEEIGVDHFPLPLSMRESTNALLNGVEVEELDTVPAELLDLM